MVKLNNKGFSLVEVLAVIVILGIICGIAVNGVLSTIKSSRDASYDILVSNIKTASIMLFEELENKNILKSDVDIYNYNSNGKIVSNSLKITINGSGEKQLLVGLQTLVSNGFLVGVNNECSGEGCSNKNEKIILNPKNNVDIGNCQIMIVKKDFSYTITRISNGASCPSDDDYEKSISEKHK